MFLPLFCFGQEAVLPTWAINPEGEIEYIEVVELTNATKDKVFNKEKIIRGVISELKEFMLAVENNDDW